MLLLLFLKMFNDLTVEVELPPNSSWEPSPKERFSFTDV